MCSKEKLIQLASIFREGIVRCKPDLVPTLREFPTGACGDASYLLARYLKDQGCGCFEYVYGDRDKDNQSHAWLEGDGLIVDITADQFKDQIGKVLVTEDGSWHKQFEEEDRHIADFERYEPSLIPALKASYRRVLKAIDDSHGAGS